MRLALVHDWLVQPGGGEDVLRVVRATFPDSQVFALIDFLAPADRERLGVGRVTTSPLQWLPLARTRYRDLLPVMPWAVERLDVSGFDAVLSISHAVAKGVRTHPGQFHACLCLSPMRYAWDLRGQYLAESGLDRGVKGWVARRALDRVQRWDLANSRRIHAWASISRYIASRVRRAYGVESRILFPPVDTAFFTPGGPRDDVYVTASRFVPYKRLDLIVRAFAAMPERRLVVIGDGPDREKVRRAGGANVEFTGQLPRAALRAQLRRARAFVFAAEEDFGIAPVEAQACGTPVIAYGRGGALETVIGLDADGRATAAPTGVFFGEQNERSIGAAIERFEAQSARFSVAACRASAERFTVAAFQSGVSALMESGLRDFRRDASSAAPRPE